MSCGVPIHRPPRTPREEYEADRRELSPEWEGLPEATRHAYETDAPRWGQGPGSHGGKGSP